uniref:Uncharacterized protein n=1 Tax=Anguilla anguilla TaxID=7936 RepID=A0A0E9Q9Q8_ANGAN
MSSTLSCPFMNIQKLNVAPETQTGTTSVICNREAERMQEVTFWLACRIYAQNRCFPGCTKIKCI